MTKDADFKKLVRDRMAKTGESYATAREQLGGGTVSGARASFAPATDGLARQSTRAELHAKLASLDHFDVHLLDDELRVSLGDPPLFEATVPLASVKAATRVPDGRAGSSIGAHGWRGKWLVNSTRENLVRLELDPPVRASLTMGSAYTPETPPRAMRWLLRDRTPRIKQFTISVDDPDAFLAALGAART